MAPACEGAAQVFDQALCACERATVFGGLATRVLPGASPATTAHVRVGGPLEVTGFGGPIEGDVTLVGTGVSVLSADGGQVAGDLRASTDIGLTGNLAIAGDAFLTGELIGTGHLTVAGDLHTGGTSQTALARVDLGGEAVSEPLALTRPCSCEAPGLLDIAGFVEAARLSNDNDAVGFDARALAATDGPVALPPGLLFVDHIDSPSGLALEITGATSLYVAEDLRVAGALTAQIAPEAQLSVFVAGGATIDGAVTLGDDQGAPIGRLYVAGGVQMDRGMGATAAPGTLTARGERARWTVNLYAPQLMLNLGGGAHVTGSVYARSLVALGGFEVVYDPSTPTHTERCSDR